MDNVTGKYDDGTKWFKKLCSKNHFYQQCSATKKYYHGMNAILFSTIIYMYVVKIRAPYTLKINYY
jgi:hypothetical protein